MSMTRSLLEFILTLLRDSDAKAAFVADPQKALADAGLGAVCREDVSDAMGYVAEYHPVTFVGERGDHVGGPDAFQPASGSSWHAHEHGPDPHASVIHQLEYITNNYSYTDSHDTILDRSVNQHIWNDGVLTQRFDDHSVTAAEHSVAGGGDITGHVTNGNDNVVGDGNSVGNASYRDDHIDDHSVRGSFTGDTIADHGGIAGWDNDGNRTTAHHSDVTATDNTLQDSPPHWHESTFTNSSHHQSFNQGSFNHEVNHQESIQDSAITHTDQHGLLNAALSPAVTIPVHHNDIEVLSHPEEHSPT
jgi:hypothetical protein